MNIRHLKHNKIDYPLWNNTVRNSIGNLPYAFTWYLDLVSPNWEALVSDGYEYIMPLPIKKKFHIPYISQPKLTQQLGIFSNRIIDEKIVSLFISKIKHYSYHIHLNENNPYKLASLYPNYTLDLNTSYEIVRSSFSKNTKRNIQKAQNSGLIINKIYDIKEVITFLETNLDCFKFEISNIAKELIKNGGENIEFWAAYTETGNIISILILLKTSQRLVYLLPLSNNDGKNQSAMFAIIDSVIYNYQNQNVILDFEGSQIPSIARFYKGFGAKYTPYGLIKKNRPTFLIGKLNTK